MGDEMEEPEVRRGAGVAWRFAATLLDGIVLVATTVALFAAFGRDGRCGGGVNLSYNVNSEYHSVCGAPAGLFFLSVLAYYLLLERYAGGTIGKLLTGLRIVDLADGSRPSWGAVVLRTVLRPIDGFLFYLVAAITVWSTPTNQRIGDLAAKTLVVDR